ncbi:hypothetical protein Dform_02168 [Dehalogenimonas formicexedens]|uniref:Lipoprotein n=1 Tax=Dehalogenimonas formicexedens TaxID=1839801 RepID=A0A1P8FAJ3_9CHLR|nr:hypothetical protein [Dehalogenimonas formicexedens]APV45472.1 hypothetical protein Dform_02168 [Dehalogenimonas formicexedens]
MKNIMVAVVGVLILAIGLTGCGEKPLNASLGQSVDLKPGQAVELNSEKMTLKFEKVLNDSRCPEGASCVWEGQVQCLVTLDLDGKKEQITLTQRGSDEGASQIYNRYLIKFDVTPYPRLNQTIGQSDYRLHVTVTIIS